MRSYVVRGPQVSNKYYVNIESAVNELSEWIVRASMAGFYRDIPLWHIDVILPEGGEK